MKSDCPSDLVSPASFRGIAGFIVVSTALLAGGCVSSYEVKVDSVTKPTAAQSVSYKLVPKNAAIVDGSLRNREAADYVRTALSGKGLYEAPDPEKADLVVYVDYGVSDPKYKIETVANPIYRTTTGEEREELVPVGRNRRGRTIYEAVTVRDAPKSEFIGYDEYHVTVTTYEKYLRLNATENKPAAEGRPPAEIWTIDVSSEGESRDIRKALPILAAASIDYVGVDSRGQKTVRIKDTDQDVAFIKKGM